MLDLQRAKDIRYQQPEGWDDAADGIYGDEDALEASCSTGEEQLIYLMRQTTQSENLAMYTGPTEATPQDPQELADLEPEENTCQDEPFC